MIEIGIEATRLQAILTGDKTVEASLGNPKYLKIRAGDILSVREDVWLDGAITTSHASAVKLRVTQVLYFETFDEMLDTVGFELAVPNATNHLEAANVYHELYSTTDEYEYGVVAMMIEPVQENG